MILNLNMILRTFLFFTLICISLVFFNFGYQGLKDIYFFNKIKIDEKIESDFEEKNKEDNNLDTSQSFVNKYVEPSTIIENEIVLTVKLNDTFDKIIKPYIRSA